MQLFTPIEYLKIDIANNFGLDKENYDKRIAWFDENENKLYDIKHLAAEPALYYAGITAYKNALEGNVNHYPISLDATASGMQLLSCLTRDYETAKLCNVIPTGNREDAYTLLFDEYKNKYDIDNGVERKDFKQAIMTLELGVTI